MSLGLFGFIALAPLLWSIVNHLDKYLISKYFKGGGVGGLMIFSSFFSIILLPIILFVDKSVFSVGYIDATILILAGLANAVSIWLYLLALSYDETTIIVPFMQMIPIFSFALGYLFLGEILTINQVIGGVIIILGVILLTVNINSREKTTIRFKTLMLMFGHSFLYALYGVLFKFVSLDEGFWSGAFWESIGLVFSGFFFFMVPSYRTEFFQVLRDNSKAVLGLNLTGEAITIIGNWITTYSSLFVPVALVSLVAAYQPLFVFIIGIFLTLYLPKIAEENITKKVLFQKIIAIFIIVGGTYLLY